MASSRFGMGFSFHDAPSPGRQSLAPVRLTKSYPLQVATTDAAETWFEENDPEGVAFEYEVLE